MTDIQVGDRIGKYEVLRELGAGGMGRVFEARDTLLGRHVALKFLRSGGVDPDLLLRGVLRECRILAELNHPNIVHLYDAAMFGDAPYFVMELVRGQPLRTICSAFGTLETFDALSIAVQILEGLCTAHGAGIIHNDLKPENVMLTAKPMGQVKLVDFGLSRSVERASTGTTGELVDGRGTPHYMAPELHRGERATEKSDVYTAGQMTHEMLTGRFVFSKSTEDIPSRREVSRLHLVAPPISVVDIRGDSLAEVERIVFRMLAKDPDERPTALEAHRLLATELGRLEAELPQLSDRTLTAEMARPVVQVPVQLSTDARAHASSRRTLPAGTAQAEPRAATPSTSGPASLPEPSSSGSPYPSRSGPASLAGAARVGGRMQTFLTTPLGSAVTTAVVASESITLHDARNRHGRAQDRAHAASAAGDLPSVDVSFASTEPLPRAESPSDPDHITGPTPPPVIRPRRPSVPPAASGRPERRRSWAVSVLVGLTSALAAFVVVLVRTGGTASTSADPSPPVAPSATAKVTASAEPPVPPPAASGVPTTADDACTPPPAPAEDAGPASPPAIAPALPAGTPALPVAPPAPSASTPAPPASAPAPKPAKPAPRPVAAAPPGQRVCDLSWRGCLPANDPVCIDLPQNPACNHGPQSSLAPEALAGLRATQKKWKLPTNPGKPAARDDGAVPPEKPRTKLPVNPRPKVPEPK